MTQRVFPRLTGLLLGGVLIFGGCSEQQPATLSQSVRTQEVRPPVESPPAELLATQRAFTEVSARVTPVVVNIRAEGAGGGPRAGALFEDFFGDSYRSPRHRRQEQSLGSGFVISPDGLILTNAHVVEGASAVTVRFSDQRVLPAELVGSDPKTDVAVLRVRSDKPLPVAVLGDSDQLKVGQWALAIGNPFGLDSTLTVGVISATGRADVGIEDYEDFIQTDASINPGNSGGPLLNIYGEVIGINTAIVASGQGIGFAIPIRLARQIAEQLIATGTVTRGWLGVSIQPLDQELARSYGLEKVTGALVTKVLADTPAAQAGIQRGDVLLTFAGREVRGVRELQLLVASAPVGKALPVEILREGRRRTLSVTIVPRDGRSASGQAPAPVVSWLGMALQQSPDGVAITGVSPQSAAAQGGVQAGDLLLAVGRREVHDLRDLDKVRREVRPGRTVVLLIRRADTTIYLALPVPSGD